MGSIRARNDSGLLFVDFRFRGERCREQTALPDNAGNRKRLDKLLEKIECAIADNTFEYRNFFPSSKNAKNFDAEKSDALTGLTNPCGTGTRPVAAQGNARATPLFRDFAETWYSEKQVEWRRSHKVIIRADLDRRLIPAFGTRRSVRS